MQMELCFLSPFCLLPKGSRFPVPAASKADCTDSIFSPDNGISSPLLVASASEDTSTLASRVQFSRIQFSRIEQGGLLTLEVLIFIHKHCQDGNAIQKTHTVGCFPSKHSGETPRYKRRRMNLAAGDGESPSFR